MTLVFENKKQKEQWTLCLKEAIISAIKKSRARDAMAVPNAAQVRILLSLLSLLSLSLSMFDFF